MMQQKKKKIQQEQKGSLIEEKDYLTEAWLQGGKAIGALAQRKKKRGKD